MAGRFGHGLLHFVAGIAIAMIAIAARCGFGNIVNVDPAGLSRFAAIATLAIGRMST
jgi:hypothetical protein